MKHRFLVIPSLLLFIIILSIGCSKKEKTASAPFKGKNVMLISVDTCRADYLEAYGNQLIKTPHISCLAEDGILFTNAVTPVPLTLPAHSSLLSGLHPIQHNVRDNFNGILSDAVVTLPELFRESGYTTMGVIGSILLSRRTGINQGFDTFLDEFSISEYRAVQPLVERKADKVTNKTMAWLKQYLDSKKKKPFFSFVHYYDPHKLYQPPSPYDEIYSNDLYGGEIAFTDEQIGKLIDFLKENGLYDDLLLILIGDHGEGLGDHEEVTHGLFLYEEAVHVPFIVKLPKTKKPKKGIQIDQNISLEDVTPTLIDLCELGIIETNGISLAPWIMGNKKKQERFICLETQYPLTYNWSPTYALRSTSWKYIHAPKPELYNIEEDRGEKRNLIKASTEKYRSMNDVLEDKLVELSRSVILMGNQQYSTERTEILSSLGYTAPASEPGQIAPDEPLPDPKDKVEVYIKNDMGLGELMKGNYDKAARLFMEIIESDSENPTSYFNLGLVYVKTSQMDKAAHYMREALKRSQKNLHIHLHLAKVLIEKGDTERAREILEALIQENPKLSDAHFQLGWMDLNQNKYESALEHFMDAKRWMPDMPNLDKSIEKAKEGLS